MTWPTPSQEWLLRAALLAGPDAGQAWRRWTAAVDLDRIDVPSQRLLPLCYRSLLAAGVREPSLGRVAGVYRYHWVRSQLLAAHLGQACLTLGRRGIDPVLVNGPALAARFYPDPGCRPLDRADLLVGARALSSAVEALGASGWRPEDAGVPPDLRGPSRPLVLEDGGEWRLTLHPAGDDVLARTVPWRLDQVAVRVLDAADTLLAVTGQGWRFRDVSPIGWVADATLLLRRASSEIDWEDLLDRAAGGALLVALRRRLRYLAQRGFVHLPEAVLRSAEARRVSRLERWEASARDGAGTCGRLLVGYGFDYWRLARGRGLRRGLAGYPGFVQAFWRLDSPWRLPRAALTRLAARCLRPRAER